MLVSAFIRVRLVKPLQYANAYNPNARNAAWYSYGCNVCKTVEMQKSQYRPPACC